VKAHAPFSRIDPQGLFLREDRFVNLRKIALLGAVLLLSASQAARADTESLAKQAAAKIVAEICADCHRSQGDANPAHAPTLMGQHKSYLAWQLRAYRLGFRDDAQAHARMWNPASKIDESIVDALAEYYASQPPAAGRPGDPALVARGKILYELGIPAQHIAGCSYCHGPYGEGDGIFPRLAGQRARYLVREISVIQNHSRNVGIMHSTVEGLSDDDVTALGVYLQSR